MTAAAEARAAQMFAVDCSEHVLTVRHDEGLYRHLAFRHPGTSLYWFDLITWPGHLAFSGDTGSYVFARNDDMLGFFLSGPGINPGYWAEKIQGEPRGARAYSEDLLREHVYEEFRDYADEHGWVMTTTAKLWEAIELEVLDQAYDEHLVREAIRDFEFMAPDQRNRTEFVFRDAREWHLQDFTHRFLYCCYAIRWGAEQYRAFLTDTPDAERRRVVTVGVRERFL